MKKKKPLTRYEIQKRYLRRKNTYKKLKDRHKWKRTRADFELGHISLRDLRWITYDAAKIDVAARSEGRLKSKSDYHRWHNSFKPYGLPKEPSKVYKEQWLGWNDWLGTDNVYDGYDRKRTRQFVPFLEAVRYVQTLKYNNILMYQKAVRNGDLEIEVPVSPNVKYKDQWQGWPHYLGKSIHARMDTLAKIEKLLLVCVNNKLPNGYVELVICESGSVERNKFIKDRIELQILKAYVYEEARYSNVLAIMDSCGVVKGKNIWLCRNVNEAVYGIGDELMFFVPPNP